MSIIDQLSLFNRAPAGKDADEPSLEQRREQAAMRWRDHALDNDYPGTAAKRRVLSRMCNALATTRGGGSLLDVGTGAGVMMHLARAHGLRPVAGTEALHSFCSPEQGIRHAYTHDLPYTDASYDHVACVNVLEHLLSEDVEPALTELRRVARSTVIVVVAAQGEDAADVWRDTLYQALGASSAAPRWQMAGEVVWLAAL